MFLLKPEISVTGKPTDQHPWARRIKDEYANKIKYAHNSIRNPEYPKKEEKVSDLNKIKFTIIGDRVTKEFIYCINLVKGLYKYRKKIFEAPEIQGITSVEWPTVLNDLKARYGGVAHCLTSSVAVIMNKKLLGGEKELKELMESMFIYNLCLDYSKESIAEFAKFIRGSGRPCVYMKLSNDGEDIGTFIFMLYSDIVPYTCANFLRLCKETKGGYSGTPIHRIVKDGWIQGGGFGLKQTDLDCENFMVPHDRRGVLCMANSGLHMECSTQFFVLLQPAPWMAHKFVAFGQLIEGKETLDKIEAVPTWYEAPNSEIIIYKAGIFNMDCHDIMINKGTNEYIEKHIEDLNDLAEVFYAALLENVFLTAQLREIERLRREHGEGGEEGESEDETAAGLRETQRFNRKKEDIEKQLQTSRIDRQSQVTTAANRATGPVPPRPTSPSANENNDFDVETYDPEYEETDYQHHSIHTPSLIVKPRKPFYIPLTDVLYPGEKDSNFDLKRFLQGDYCLESDLKQPAKSFIPVQSFQYLSEVFDLEDLSDSDNVDISDEKELHKVLKGNVDTVSFAGSVVRAIGKRTSKTNLLEGKTRSELISDDQLRRLRKATQEHTRRFTREKKVSISLPLEKPTHIQIKRRQTGFVRPEDLRNLHRFSRGDDDHDEDDDEDDEDEKKKGFDEKDEAEENRKVRMADSTPEKTGQKVSRRTTPFARTDVDVDEEEDDEDDKLECKQKVRIAATKTSPAGQVPRRPTAFVRGASDYVHLDDDDDDDDDHHKLNDMDDDDDEDKQETRKSVLVRLLDEVKGNEEPPTLKDYKPMSEYHQHKILLTHSSNDIKIKSDSESIKEYQRLYRHSQAVENTSYEHVLNLQHGKKLARKISSDYVKTIDQIEHKIENSIRSVEFAKTRPAMSVAEYQMKNRKYQEEQKNKEKSTEMEWKGLRLPGDTPLHSVDDFKEKEKAHKPHRAHHTHHTKAK